MTQLKAYDPYTPILEMLNNINITREFQYRRYSKSIDVVLKEEQKTMMTLQNFYEKALNYSIDIKTLKKGKHYGYLYLQNNVLARIGVKTNSKGESKIY